MRVLDKPRRPCDVESLEDFNRYYQHCYLGLPEENRITPCKYRGIDSGGRENIVLHAIVKEGKLYKDDALRIVPWEWAKLNLSFGRPLLGNINIPLNYVFLSIRGERSPTKGYSSRSGNISSLVHNEWYTKEKCSFSISSPQSVYEVFNPTYTAPHSAWLQLSAGMRAGCALSRNIGMYTTPDSLFPLVSYKMNTVGYAEMDGVVTLYKEFNAYKKAFESLGFRVVTG